MLQVEKELNTSNVIVPNNDSHVQVSTGASMATQALREILNNDPHIQVSTGASIATQALREIPNNVSHIQVCRQEHL